MHCVFHPPLRLPRALLVTATALVVSTLLYPLQNQQLGSHFTEAPALPVLSCTQPSSNIPPPAPHLQPSTALSKRVVGWAHLEQQRDAVGKAVDVDARLDVLPPHAHLQGSSAAGAESGSLWRVSFHQPGFAQVQQKLRTSCKQTPQSSGAIVDTAPAHKHSIYLDPVIS